MGTDFWNWRWCKILWNQSQFTSGCLYATSIVAGNGFSTENIVKTNLNWWYLLELLLSEHSVNPVKLNANYAKLQSAWLKCSFLASYKCFSWQFSHLCICSEAKLAYRAEVFELQKQLARQQAHFDLLAGQVSTLIQGRRAHVRSIVRSHAAAVACSPARPSTTKCAFDCPWRLAS